MWNIFWLIKTKIRIGGNTKFFCKGEVNKILCDTLIRRTREFSPRLFWLDAYAQLYGFVYQSYISCGRCCGLFHTSINCRRCGSAYQICFKCQTKMFGRKHTVHYNDKSSVNFLNVVIGDTLASSDKIARIGSTV